METHETSDMVIEKRICSREARALDANAHARPKSVPQQHVFIQGYTNARDSSGTKNKESEIVCKAHFVSLANVSFRKIVVARATPTVPLQLIS